MKATTIQQEKRRWVKQWDCPSHSNPDKFYKVSQDNFGEFGCDCPVWKFHRRECKHIKQVKRHLDMNNDFGRTLFREIYNFIPYRTDGTEIKIERKIDHKTATENIIVYFPLLHFTDCPYIQPDGSSKYDGFTHNAEIYENMMKQGIPKTEIKKYFKIK